MTANNEDISTEIGSGISDKFEDEIPTVNLQRNDSKDSRLDESENHEIINSFSSQKDSSNRIKSSENFSSQTKIQTIESSNEENLTSPSMEKVEISKLIENDEPKHGRSDVDLKCQSYIIDDSCAGDVINKKDEKVNYNDDVVKDEIRTESDAYFNGGNTDFCISSESHTQSLDDIYENNNGNDLESGSRLSSWSPSLHEEESESEIHIDNESEQICSINDEIHSIKNEHFVEPNPDYDRRMLNESLIRLRETIMDLKCDHSDTMHEQNDSQRETCLVNKEDGKTDVVTENKDYDEYSDEQEWYWDYDENTWKLWDDDWDDEDYEYLDSEEEALCDELQKKKNEGYMITKEEYVMGPIEKYDDVVRKSKDEGSQQTDDHVTSTNIDKIMSEGVDKEKPKIL